MKICIYGYKLDELGQWSPKNIETGLPGSEEAVVYLSEVIKSHGHDLQVYFDPDQEVDPKYGNWYSIDDFNPDTYYDLLIGVRNIPDKCNAKVKCFWSHDVACPGISLPPEADRIFLLSEFHRNSHICLDRKADRRVEIIGNGIVPSQFQEKRERKNKYSLGYFSNYSRGLPFLISLYPHLKNRYPELTLTVCYGKQTWYPSTDQLAEELSLKMKELGIIERGKVGHQELADLMKETSVWVYPIWNYTETYCITAMKAQAAGMIPVVNKLGALYETVHPDAPCIFEHDVDQIEIRFWRKLCNVLDQIDKHDSDRQKYIDFAMKNDWELVYQKIMKKER